VSLRASGAEGLRERKKAQTRAAIQAEALRLFRERGYDTTTVEDIIDAAEVSASTFYRYFPTKADVVLLHPYHPMFVDAFLTQPQHLKALPALRGAVRSLLSRLSADVRDQAQERVALAVSVPDLRATLLDQLAGAMHLIAAAVGQRTGRTADDPRVRALAGAMVGVGVGVMLTLAEDPSADLATLLDQAMGQLEAGLAL
jgi:AcrR family transcriptional regulator